MKKKLLLYLILIFIPYIVFSYTFQILEVGNDFELYYFVYKKYIFELLKLGHFPSMVSCRSIWNVFDI